MLKIQAASEQLTHNTNWKKPSIAATSQLVPSLVYCLLNLVTR
uniref:Uncharacterized protein n=1 Tax=Rhizophora mucronata TaxID=61149 RepID=A0A2P2MZN8_RHIMU